MVKPQSKIESRRSKVEVLIFANRNSNSGGKIADRQSPIAGTLNFAKFLSVLILILFSASACRFFQSGETNENKPAFTADELKSEVPFSTKEPDVFQLELVTTAAQTERVIFIAKNGANRRLDYNYGTAHQLTDMQGAVDYLILPGKKIYAENPAGTGAAGAPDDWQSFLTSEWLNQKRSVRFEKLETTENITKYRVVLDESAASEIYIYIDEKLGMPIKQEFLTAAGEQKTLEYAVELKNIKLQTDDNMFAVPADFKKVSIEELRKELNKISE